jgi:hypothetical protein
MILKNIFAENFSEKIGVLTRNKAKLCKISIITLVFVKNANFLQKIGKIAENCDHNIGPWSGNRGLQILLKLLSGFF